MPSFISNGGDWTPAQEKAVNVRTGETYEGPDREAKQMIEDAGGTIGMKAVEDPENIMRARQLGMTVEQYLKMNEVPSAAQKAKDEAAKTKVVDHKPTPAKRGVQSAGGGTTIKGNFGDPPQV